MGGGRGHQARARLTTRTTIAFGKNVSSSSPSRSLARRVVSSRGVVFHVFVRGRFDSVPRGGIPGADLFAILLGIVPAQRHLAALRDARVAGVFPRRTRARRGAQRLTAARAERRGARSRNSARRRRRP